MCADPMEIRLLAVELFSGAGGMTLGFQRAGFQTVVAVEQDPKHVEMHLENFPGCQMLERDVRELTGSDFTPFLSQSPDLVFGGPPCQGFSAGGHRDIADKRNGLTLEFARIVRLLRPRYFVLENVQGLLTSGRPILERFQRSVLNSGYRLVEPLRVLNAQDFGVPQNRKRLFLLGYRIGETEPKYPDKQTGQSPTVWDAIGDLPMCDDPADPQLDGDMFVGRLSSPSPYASALRKPHRPLAEPLAGGFLVTTHSSPVIERFAATGPGEREKVSRFVRLDRNGRAPTIRAGTGRERGAFTAPRPIHPDLNRCITVREAARLSSFPDSFRFYPNRWYGYAQVGNAVPPLLAEAVASEIMSAALGQEHNG